MSAQNQHYVPKHLLRQFLWDEKGERVTVYDKHEERTFVTSIKNIMAERRFNDFTFEEDWRVSFEPLACGAEDQVLPAYNKVLSERRLDGSSEQKAALAVLMAFQFLRTKSAPRPMAALGRYAPGYGREQRRPNAGRARVGGLEAEYGGRP
ncbi:MAG TPA: DUF4238 domain-containing protein [Allosphingosinicella sp.]